MLSDKAQKALMAYADSLDRASRPFQRIVAKLSTATAPLTAAMKDRT